MRLRMIMACIAVLLPLAASATHFNDVTVNADCFGWSIDAEIQWRSTVFEGEFSYVVQLLDSDNNVLETQDWSGTLTREMNPQTYSFAGEWTVSAPAGSYHVDYEVYLMAPWGWDQIDEETVTGSESIECGTVSSEAMTWSAVKALY